jgi:carbon monoxide dehydrogenase subunit G
MELDDQIEIAAPRAVVYAALNNPEILQQAIPGCEEIEQLSPTEMTARVVLKIGPVKAKFTGRVLLDNAGAPDSFSLSGEGDGGVAGAARGGADVTLADKDGGTLLTYKARADVSGKIAQLGSRLVLSTAKKLSRSFFENFQKIMDEQAATS